MKQLLILLLFLPLVTIAQERQLAGDIAKAKNPQSKGLAIARMADYRNTGWRDSEANMIMTLKNRQGRTSVRYVRTRTMEVDGDGDKGLSIFDRPRDVKGTAMLTWSHSLKPDDQWLYLPALKRVKRISSRNKSGPFMGSEFAYEDISSQEVDKYTYKYLRDEMLNGMNCYVMERYPTYKHSGYTLQIVWLDKENFNAQKTVFYDRKRKRNILKTLIFKDYKPYKVSGKIFWRASEFFMRNHQTGKTTVLKWSKYKFAKGFTKRDFDRNTLKRVR